NLGLIDQPNVHPSVLFAGDTRLQRWHVLGALDDVQVAALREAGRVPKLGVELRPALGCLHRKPPFARVAALLANTTRARPGCAWRARRLGLFGDEDASASHGQVVRN